MLKLSRRNSLRTLGLGAGVLAFAPRLASAAEKVSVRLKWLPQCQFAGFYVAKAKGYYDAAGLDMTINPGGPNINSEALVSAGSDTFGVGGGADSIMVARTKNLPIVALALPFQLSPNTLVARKTSKITGPKDFRGKKVATFFTGAQHAFDAEEPRQGRGPDADAARRFRRRKSRRSDHHLGEDDR
jgi:NitT/TauT family transport system substrate-binding protein